MYPISSILAGLFWSFGPSQREVLRCVIFLLYFFSSDKHFHTWLATFFTPLRQHGAPRCGLRFLARRTPHALMGASWLWFAQTAFSGTAPPQTERWGIFQLNLTAQVGAGNPFETPLSATFTHQGGSRTVTVGGFFDGDDQFKVRFSPDIEGLWSYVTASTEAALKGVRGELLVTPALAAQRGPVESRGFGLYYADGTPHLSVGTTCYQWTSEDAETQEQTLQTLAASGFNKIRMTLLPKWYVYNHANPVQAGCAYEVLPGSIAANATAWACVGSGCPPTAGSFDLRRFNVSYWRNVERLLGTLTLTRTRTLALARTRTLALALAVTLTRSL